MLGWEGGRKGRKKGDVRRRGDREQRMLGKVNEEMRWKEGGIEMGMGGKIGERERRCY